MGLAFSPLMQLFTVGLATLVTVQLMRWLIWYRQYFKFYSSLPGESDFHLLWGNLHKVRNKSPEERIHYSNGLMHRFPKWCRFWAGPFNAVVSLYHPDTVKEILKTSEPKPFMYNLALPWLGKGLLLANGERWARSRRLLTPAFHFDILKPYVTISNRAVEVLMDKFSKCAKQNESVEIFSPVSLCTLDVILQCAMSCTDNVQSVGETHPYVQAVNELSELWFDRGRNPFLYNDFIYGLTPAGRRFIKQCNVVHSLSEKVIRDRKHTLATEGPSTKRHKDFLDILLTARDETGQGLTDLEIRNEVDTFMFEGHDTTASAISWILYSLALNQDVQQKAQEEVDSVLDSKGNDSDEIEWGDLNKLEYLALVIKEGMRLHCPVPFIQRQLTQPVTIQGVEMPVGTFCNIHLLNLHHNPEVWEDAWKFNPDRFNPENMKNKDTYAFVPFSAGPRNCIGQHFALNEEKVVIGRLLRKFRFSVDESHVVTRKVAAVMRAENGIKLFATHRQSAK